MAKLGMLLPAAGRNGVIDFVVNAVNEAWSNPCPPVIVGVGIGGTAEKAMLMAKHALVRKVGEPSPDKETAALEKEILHKVNNLGIGPDGLWRQDYRSSRPCGELSRPYHRPPRGR